jgi:hypothetical protein
MSIQQSRTTYTSNTEEVEIWNTQHTAFLEPYGTGEDPYAHVPIEIAALHIAALESET